MIGADANGLESDMTANTPAKLPCAIGLALIVCIALPACVRRTMTITTEPPGARVFLNDQEVGRSTVTTDFLWYGDYRVDIRKDGFRTLETNWNVKPPWYQLVPIDFFSEVLWPGHLHDTHARHFVLEEAQEPDSQELLIRAEELRRQALDARK